MHVNIIQEMLKLVEEDLFVYGNSPGAIHLYSVSQGENDARICFFASLVSNHKITVRSAKYKFN